MTRAVLYHIGILLYMSTPKVYLFSFIYIVILTTLILDNTINTKVYYSFVVMMYYLSEVY